MAGGAKTFAIAVAVAIISTGLNQLGPASAVPPSSITYVHDDAGRLEAVIDPSHGVARYTYDANGNELSITRTAASVLSVVDYSPHRARAGDALTIYGTHFGATPGANNVKIGVAVATVLSATPTMLVVRVPQPAPSGTVAVTTSGKTSRAARSFAPILEPIITSVSPTVADIGGTVTSQAPTSRRCRAPTECA